MRGRITEPDLPVKRARIDAAQQDSKHEANRLMQEQEQALVRLVEERRSQIRRIEEQTRELQAQLVEAQNKFTEAEAQLACLRCRPSPKISFDDSNAGPIQNEPVKVKIEPDVDHSSKNGKIHLENGPVKVKTEPDGLSKGEHADLVLSVRGSKAPSYVNVLRPLYFASQHKRKLRSLAVNPTSCQVCVTSALDGLMNVWQIRGKGEDLSLVSSIDCLSPGQRRWPEDLAWHPSGESLFACYSADGKDNQVAIISSSGKAKVQFLEEKPHEKGIINSLVFMPSDVEPCFATGGCDHAVVLWKQEEMRCHWKPKILHKSLHSSAVMGLAGMQHKPLVLSVGLDKRVVGFDTQYCRQDFRHQLDSRALGMLPNPVDLNLFMVQTGYSGRQLRLFDVRMHGSELHAFGWRQESSECQSALINQSWSPDGFHIASGSTDPKVHIFDIRYNSNEPSQSVKAHQKRVFKAVWHHTLPLLISISSDLQVGLLRTSG